MRLLVAWLLVAGTSSGAFALDGQVAGAEFDLDGKYDAVWDAVGAVVRGRGNYSWEVTSEGAVLRLYNAPAEYARLQPTPLTPETSVFVEDHPLELMGEWRVTGPLRVEQETGKPYLQWIPTRPTDASCQCGSVQTLAVGGFQSAAQQASVQDRLGPHVKQLGVGAPPGKGAYVASAEEVEAAGEGRLIYFGVQVVAGERGVWTGSRVNESRSAQVDGGGHYVLDRIFAVVDGSHTLRASGPGAEWAVTGASIRGHVDLLVRRATGTVTAAGQEHDVTDDHLQVVGELHAGAEFEDGALWSFTGSGHFVGIDTVALHGSQSWPAASAPAAGLAAVVFLFWSGLLHKLAGALAGLRTRDPLAQDVRAALARTLLKCPGHSHMELARMHGLSRRSVRFHLEVLLKSGIASEHRDGKIPRYTLNSGSSLFPRNGKSAAGAFAAMAHPLRARIVELARKGPVHHALISDVPESTFRRHCKLLEETGMLVQGSPQDPWRLALDPDEMKEHYRRAFLIRQGLWRAFEEGEACKDREAKEALRRLGVWSGQGPAGQSTDLWSPQN